MNDDASHDLPILELELTSVKCRCLMILLGCLLERIHLVTIIICLCLLVIVVILLLRLIFLVFVYDFSQLKLFMLGNLLDIDLAERVSALE